MFCVLEVWYISDNKALKSSNFLFSVQTISKDIKLASAEQQLFTQQYLFILQRGETTRVQRSSCKRNMKAKEIQSYSDYINVVNLCS